MQPLHWRAFPHTPPFIRQRGHACCQALNSSGIGIDILFIRKVEYRLHPGRQCQQPFLPRQHQPGQRTAAHRQCGAALALSLRRQ